MFGELSGDEHTHNRGHHLTNVCRGTFHAQSTRGPNSFHFTQSQRRFHEGRKNNFWMPHGGGRHGALREQKLVDVGPFWDRARQYTRSRFLSLLSSIDPALQDNVLLSSDSPSTSTTLEAPTIRTRSLNQD